MSLVKHMDFQAIGRIVHNVERELKRTRPDLKIDSPEWGRAMNKRVMEVVRKTQPTWDPKDRSYIGGTRSQVLRWLTVFHSQRETTVGMLNRANHQYKLTGDIKPLLKTYSLVASTNVMYTAITTMMAMLVRGKKPDPEEFMTDLGMTFFKMYYIGEVPALMLKVAMKGVTGKPVSEEAPLDVIVGEPFSYLNKGIYNATAAMRYAITDEVYKSGKNKGKKKWKVAAVKAGENLGVAAALFTGTPAYAPYKIGKGVYYTGKELLGYDDNEEPMGDYKELY